MIKFATNNLNESYGKQRKIKLYQNTNNLGCYHNKLKSISYCSNDWAILLDSDNITALLLS